MSQRDAPFCSGGGLDGEAERERRPGGLRVLVRRQDAPGRTPVHAQRDCLCLPVNGRLALEGQRALAREAWSRTAPSAVTSRLPAPNSPSPRAREKEGGLHRARRSGELDLRFAGRRTRPTPIPTPVRPRAAWPPRRRALRQCCCRPCRPPCTRPEDSPRGRRDERKNALSSLWPRSSFHRGRTRRKRCRRRRRPRLPRPLLPRPLPRPRGTGTARRERRRRRGSCRPALDCRPGPSPRFRSRRAPPGRSDVERGIEKEPSGFTATGALAPSGSRRQLSVTVPPASVALPEMTTLSPNHEPSAGESMAITGGVESVTNTKGPAGKSWPRDVVPISRVGALVPSFAAVMVTTRPVKLADTRSVGGSKRRLERSPP